MFSFTAPEAAPPPTACMTSAITSCILFRILTGRSESVTHAAAEDDRVCREATSISRRQLEKRSVRTPLRAQPAIALAQATNKLAQNDEVGCDKGRRGDNGSDDPR